MRTPGLSDLRWAWTKVRRRLAHLRHDQRVRRAFSAGATMARPPVSPALPWAADATPPGAAAALPQWRAALSAETAAAEAVLRHDIAVLSPVPGCIDIVPATNALQLPGAEEIDSVARGAYRRIDWHCDFRSGHRWHPQLLYLDVRVAPVAGADIKTPRELSRFQHIAPLSACGERGATEFLLQVLDWIDANPPGRGVNWACTMDVALRALGWIWGLRQFEESLAQRYPRALARIAASLEAHGAHIEDNLEYYEECTNNHYLANIAGLVYIGAAFPGFAAADRWLLFGAQQLLSEMSREVLDDGSAHESSTHYHRLVAELFASSAALIERLPAARRARLARVDRRAHPVRPRLRAPASSALNLGNAGTMLPASFHTRLARMAEFTAALVKPNGLVPQFGDNDSGRAHKLLGHGADERDHRHLVAVIAQLCGAARLMPQDPRARAEAQLIAGGIAPPLTEPSVDASGARCFPDAGIAVLRGPRAWLAVTCGPNGLGGRGGHGHNDKLSFEFNVDGRDFIVDGGCPAYTGDPALRNRFRATAAHSTIAVEGREQDPIPPGIAGLFRLPQRCEPRLALGSGLQVIASHAGFGTVHQRRFTLDDSRLVIDDCFASQAPRTLRFNLDPAVEVRLEAAEQSAAGSIVLESAGVTLSLRIAGASEPRLVDGCFSRGFGVPVATRALVLRVTAATVRTEIDWT